MRKIHADHVSESDGYHFRDGNNPLAMRERARVRGEPLPVPLELLIFAKQLRKGQTNAETLLWSLLRGRRFCGFKFRRQQPIYGYILDFYCYDAGLAVELDGGGHNDEEQRLYDGERTRVLEAANIQVIRFWNNEGLNSIENVLEKLYVQLVVETTKS